MYQVNSPYIALDQWNFGNLWNVDWREIKVLLRLQPKGGAELLLHKYLWSSCTQRWKPISFTSITRIYLYLVFVLGASKKSLYGVFLNEIQHVYRELHLACYEAFCLFDTSCLRMSGDQHAPPSLIRQFLFFSTQSMSQQLQQLHVQTPVHWWRVLENLVWKPAVEAELQSFPKPQPPNQVLEAKFWFSFLSQIDFPL